MTLVLFPVEGQTIAHRKKANLSKKLNKKKKKTIRLFTENVYNKRDKNDFGTHMCVRGIKSELLSCKQERFLTFAPYIKLGLENRICLIVL